MYADVRQFIERLTISQGSSAALPTVAAMSYRTAAKLIQLHRGPDAWTGQTCGATL